MTDGTSLFSGKCFLYRWCVDDCGHVGNITCDGCWVVGCDEAVQLGHVALCVHQRVEHLLHLNSTACLIHSAITTPKKEGKGRV